MGCGDSEAWPVTDCSPTQPLRDAKNPFLAVVTTNRKLNQGTERHLMHLELDILDSKKSGTSCRHALPKAFCPGLLFPR